MHNDSAPRDILRGFAGEPFFEQVTRAVENKSNTLKSKFINKKVTRNSHFIYV